MTTQTATHRVVCNDHTHETTSLVSAQRYLARVERGGHCPQVHTIQVHIDESWAPLHIAQARTILAAKLGTIIETPDGPVVKAHGGWSKETGQRADALADPSTNPTAWVAALGPHERTTLTADGQGARTDRWCECAPTPVAETWVRYERWIPQGRDGHGYLCPTCRSLTQTG